MDKRRIIIIAVAALALIAFYAYWLKLHPAPKYIIAKKKAAAVSIKKKAPALPVIIKKIKQPQVAIVMDDFGYNMNNIEELFTIKGPITLSILPDLPYSTKIAEAAHSRGYEAILHLPLEPHRKDVRQEVDTIKSGMEKSEIVARLKEEIETVPYIVGVSSHMGSKSTEEKGLMITIFEELKNRGLYFFDSLTSRESVCSQAAKLTGIRYGKRDIFLDNSEDIPYIEKQIMTLRRMAFSRGTVIAVCHDRPNTIATLAKLMPLMARDGIKFVYLSELVG